MALKSGDVLVNRYHIVKLLGEGFSGAVYRAWDTRLEQAVILREINATDQEAQRRFDSQARLLINLHHPNLQSVVDYFILPGHGLFLVMHFVEGQSLRELLYQRGGPLSEAEALSLIRQVADALDYLHTRMPPVIHRDITLQNIIVTVDGRAMLIGFDATTLLVGFGQIATPGYSPPEQYAGQTDARSDVYALGATLYAVLTGQQPPASIERLDGWEMLHPIKLFNPTISLQTEAAVLSAMQLSPENRPSAAVFHYALSMADKWATRGLDPIPRAAPGAPTGPSLPAATVNTQRLAAGSSLSPSYRLDAAVPREVVVGQWFDLAVAVRRSESPLLREEGLSRVRSGSVQVEWPADANWIDLRAHIHAPDCHIMGQPFQLFRLHAGRDSPVVYFSLMPERLGEISIRVTLFQMFLAAGSARLSVPAGGQLVGGLETNVLSRMSWLRIRVRRLARRSGGLETKVSAHVRLSSESTASQAVYSLLIRAFSVNELHDLAAKLDIDFDSLEGTTRQRKASELLDYCRRRGRTEDLIARIMLDRPNWMELVQEA